MFLHISPYTSCSINFYRVTRVFNYSCPRLLDMYIDDILVFSSSLEKHIHHLQLVLERVITANLKLKPSKCHSVREEVEYLGHVIMCSGLKTEAKHVEAVQHFARPNSLKSVRQYLGMCAYYRRFIPCFSDIARPLHNLKRKGADFVWTEECETFWNLRKDLLQPLFWPTRASRNLSSWRQTSVDVV